MNAGLAPLISERRASSKSRRGWRREAPGLPGNCEHPTNLVRGRVEKRAVKTVLLVDDTVEIRYLLRMLLANVTFCQVVAEAENGRDAVELARTLHPDVVILDVLMPVMDGAAALPRILEVSPRSKVLVYSSRPEAREELLRLGAVGYLEKGRDPQEVVRAVRELVTPT